MQKLFIFSLIVYLFIFSVHFSATGQSEQEDTTQTSIYDLTLEELMNLEVVTAGKMKQKISEAAAVISVITDKQIHQRGYSNVGEALSSIPGIDMLYDYYQYNIGIRGINGGMRAWSRIVKVMIDNQPVSFRPSGENWLSDELIPIEMIKRIEVVRGPNSALYGANAYLGVINIITKNGNDVDGLFTSVKAENKWGNWGFGGSAIIGLCNDKTDILFGASYSESKRSGLYLNNIPGQSYYDENKESKEDISKPLSVYGKIKHSSNWGHFNVDVHYQYLNKFGEFQDWAVLTHQNHMSLYNMYARTQYKKQFGENFDLHFAATYSKGEPTENEKLVLDEAGIADWVRRDVGYSGIDLDLEMDYSYKQTGSLTFGIDYSRENQNLQTYYWNWDDKDEENPTGQVLDNKIFQNAGIYFQSIISMGELLQSDDLTNLEFTAGIRYDIHNIYGNTFNYRLAAVYGISPSLFTKVLYGTSFKAPASTQLYTTILKQNGVIGNPNLKPEEAQTFEVVIGAKLTDGINIDVNGFYNIVDNKVEFVKSPDNVSNIMPENISQTHSYGIENSIIYQNRYMKNHLNISYQESIVQKDDPVEGNIEEETSLFPQFMVKFGTNLLWRAAFLSFYVEGAWISSRLSSNQNTYFYDPVDKTPYELSDYFVFNACLSTIGFKPFGKNKTQISFNCKNILNQEFYYPGFRKFDIPGQKRTFILKISQYF